MKFQLENVSELERKIVFEIPASIVDAKFALAYQAVQKQANLPGFRKGKAPLQVIKQKFKGNVVGDVVNEIVKEAYVKALEEKNLQPVSFPEIAFDDIQEGKNFSFTAVLEVRPEIKLAKTSGLEIEKEKMEVKDSDINDILKNLQDSRMSHQDILIDRPLQNGDVAIINFAGKVGGEELPGGTANDYPLEIGSNQFIPGFEEKLIGMNVGQSRVVDLAFPEDYHAKDIAGKAVTFDVKLNKMQSKELPELNDEFARSVGTYENLEALKTNIRETLTKRESTRIQDELRKRAMNALVDANPVNVPKSQIKEQKQLLVQDFQERMKKQGMSESELNGYIQNWDADFDKSASFLICSGYIINQLAKDKDIKATEEDRQGKLMAYSQDSGIQMDQLLQFYKSEEARTKLDYQILEEKVLDLVISQSKVKEVNKADLKDKDANTNA